MKTCSRGLLSLVLSLCSLPCFAHHMAVVVAKQSRITNLSSIELARIFRGEMKKWPDGKDVALVLHRNSTGEAVTLEHLNRMTAQQWQRWKLEHKKLINLVDSDQDLLDVVESTPGAIGMVDVRSVNGRVTVVRVDGKVPLEDGYLPH